RHPKYNTVAMAIPDIELIIARRADGATTASMRVALTAQRADLVPGTPITLDDESLKRLIVQPDVYGAALTAMVFASKELLGAWREARGYADGLGVPLRLRLNLEGDDTLHALHWELLRDPIDSTPLAHSQRTRLSRFLPTASLRAAQASAPPQLRAVVAVANPAELPSFGMQPVDSEGEVARAQEGLADLSLTILDGREGRPAATMAAIAAAL